MTAIPNMGMELSFKIVSSFSGPNTASPISLNLISLPFRFATIRLLNSSSELTRPNVLTVNSVAVPESFPLGNSIFCCCNAICTSLGVRLNAVSFAGSNQIRIEYLFSPHICIPLTPGIVCSLSNKTLLQNSVNSN